jgi:large subunit ribosomal protein L24
MAARIRKGDKVVVITGKDKGKTGEVLGIMAKDGRALVSGVNIGRKHQKQTASQQGGMISKEMPIHLSNLAHVDPKDDKPTRIGFKFVGEGDDRKKVRFAKRSGELIDG